MKRNEDSRKEITKLHDLVLVYASAGDVVQALEAAKKKLKVMKTIKKEMILKVTSKYWSLIINFTMIWT